MTPTVARLHLADVVCRLSCCQYAAALADEGSGSSPFTIRIAYSYHHHHRRRKSRSNKATNNAPESLTALRNTVAVSNKIHDLRNILQLALPQPSPRRLSSTQWRQVLYVPERMKGRDVKAFQYEARDTERQARQRRGSCAPSY